MDHVVDLDIVHAELDRRRPAWTRRGLAVGKFTWRDGDRAPARLVTDRALALDSDSLGMAFETTSGSEANLVLWTGGWADLEALIDGQIASETPQFVDVRSRVAIADALVERMLSPLTR